MSRKGAVVVHTADVLSLPLIGLPVLAAATKPASVREVGSLPPDEDLVLRARDGERWAEEALYRRHARRLLLLATRLLGARAEAEDVVQDAFVSAFRDLPKLAQASAFGAWIGQITVRLVHRRWRRAKLRRALGFRSATGQEAALEALVDPRANAEVRAELAELDAQLARLPIAERSAWMLRHVEGMRLEHVATLSACSLATAKRRIAKAHALLRAHVAMEDGRDVR